MTTFYMILLIILCIFLLGALVYMWYEKEYWVKKYMDAIEEMYPIQWDYTREKGWSDGGR